MSEPSGNTETRYARLEALALALRERRADKSLVESLKGDIDAATPEDVARLVDGLVDQGIDMAELKPLVAKLLNLLHEALTREPRLEAGDSPFLALLLLENEKILESLAKGRAAALALRAAGGSAGTARAGALAALARFVDTLASIEAHYRRKENVVFPLFEELYPRWRCTGLMWSLHDDARAARKRLSTLLAEAEPDEAAINASLGALFFAVAANVYREDRVLYQVLSRAAPRERLDDHLAELLEYGPGLLDPDTFAVFAAKARRPLAELAAKGTGAGPASPLIDAADAVEIPLDSGSLPRLVLDLVLKALPLDCTFVDADDRVRWFSNGAHRIFPRSPAIIGREVRNCHPPESVGRVLAILDAFRSGQKDSASFWLTLRGRFIHIEYFAIRSASGKYLGCLEASQDLTEKRALSGEKRLD